MSIVVNHKTLKNFTVTLPGVGKKTIDANGQFEHEHLEEVEELLFHFPEYSVDGDDEKEEDEEEEDLNEKSETDELNSKVDEIGDEDELTEEEKQAIIASLPSKTRKELEELCKPFPGAEWRGKNKEALAEYLKGKL